MKKKKDGKVKLPALHSEHRLHLCVSDVSLLSQAAVKVCVKVCVSVCVCVASPVSGPLHNVSLNRPDLFCGHPAGIKY